MLSSNFPYSIILSPSIALHTSSTVLLCVQRYYSIVAHGLVCIFRLQSTNTYTFLHVSVLLHIDMCLSGLGHTEDLLPDKICRRLDHFLGARVSDARINDDLLCALGADV